MRNFISEYDMPYTYRLLQNGIIRPKLSGSFSLAEYSGAAEPPFWKNEYRESGAAYRRYQMFNEKLLS